MVLDVTSRSMLTPVSMQMDNDVISREVEVKNSHKRPRLLRHFSFHYSLFFPCQNAFIRVDPAQWAQQSFPFAQARTLGRIGRLAGKLVAVAAGVGSEPERKA